MGRLFAPVLAFAAAAYVWNANKDATNEFVFLFPMNLVFEDPVVAGQRSWQVLAAVGALWLTGDLISLAIGRGKATDDEAE